MNSRRNPTRGVGWGAGWVPPYEAPTEAPAQQSVTKKYSYLDSRGYCAEVLKKARRLIGPADGTDFSAMLPPNPLPLGVSDAFDQNERAALAEISRTPANRLHELGILKDLPGKHRPEPVAPAWNTGD